MIQSKTISEFLSNEYKDFALYTIENRAIPSVIDGFKPSQRKVIYVCNNKWKTGKEKSMKIFQLGGLVAAEAYYHHGSSSLESTIITMAQEFKNSLPLLEEHGQFGSLRSPVAGAARYIGTKLSDNFKLLYKDFELIEHKEEEGVSIEPHYFLPILPAVLLNGSSGIAVGFATNILNRNPIDVIKACKNVINGRKVTLLKPYNKFFKGDYVQDSENNKKWYIRGKFTRKNTTTVEITELPPSMTYEKYDAILEKLLDDKVIVSYEDNCKDDINYTIKFTRNVLSELSDDDLIKVFKLEETSTEIFTTLDENGKMKIFDTVDEIVKYFVNFRIGYYVKRKNHRIKKLNDELLVLSNKSRFIKAILDGKLEIKNKPKSEIISGCEKLKLDKMNDSYDYLLRMPLWSLTKELFDKLMKDHKAKAKELEDYKKIEPKDMYLSELNDLLKLLK